MLAPGFEPISPFNVSLLTEARDRTMSSVNLCPHNVGRADSISGYISWTVEFPSISKFETYPEMYLLRGSNYVEYAHDIVA